PLPDSYASFEWTSAHSTWRKTMERWRQVMVECCGDNFEPASGPLRVYCSSHTLPTHDIPKDSTCELEVDVAWEGILKNVLSRSKWGMTSFRSCELYWEEE